ncbi:hypothetical protein [Gimibacter soli]|uniref:Uncharacterized protein n=1 Tax=Gimibacter soli TaxID=3024400 RepID=A0AAF0BKL5_9PROT|nr:hypothetical protein [Gimibacter soli]WCL54419.1 hypothetical protein PH603_01430 [Gimibacter soli]
MTKDLQLRDYEEGYRFRVLCRTCRYGWNEEPAGLLTRKGLRKTLYLEELEAKLCCPRCRRTSTKITPIIIKPQHHFVGGMA